MLHLHAVNLEVIRNLCKLYLHITEAAKQAAGCLLLLSFVYFLLLIDQQFIS
jgi:hypothetical protein